MKPEETKLLLSTYRPSGADHSAPEFREALDIVNQDTELSDWFSIEHASDQAFANALHDETPVSVNLKTMILESAYGDVTASSEDAELLNFDNIQVPAGLRDKILNDFQIEQDRQDKVVPISSFQKHWRAIASVAAIAFLVISLTITNQPQANTENFANTSTQPPQVEAPDPYFLTAISALKNQSAQLYMEVTDEVAYLEWLEDYGASSLPEDIQATLYSGSPLGAYMIELDGNLTAIFEVQKADGQTVYLMASTKKESTKNSEFKDGRWSAKRLTTEDKELYLISEEL